MMGKVLFGAALALAAVTQASAFDRALSGLWYNPAQSGHGFEVTAIDADSASVAWYVYNKSGQPVWVSALLDETSPGVLSGNANYVQGIKFGEFTSGGIQVKNWGTLKLTFADCENATVEYNGTLTLDDGTGFGSGTLPLKKLAGVTGLACAGTKASVAGMYEMLQRSTSPVRQRGGFALLDPDGSALFAFAGYGVFHGTYNITAAGNLTYAVTGVTMAPVKLPNNATTASYTGTLTGRTGDYFTGTYNSTPETGTLTQRWLGGSSRTYTLANVAGNYTDPVNGSGYTATLGTNGSISGRRPNNCNFAGTLTPTAGGRAFNATISVTSCGFENGEYTGKVLALDYTDYGDGRGILIAVKNASNSMAVTLRRQ